MIFQTDFLLKFWDCSGAKVCKSCRAWQMLSNTYFLAKFRFDTAENEPAKNLQNSGIIFANFALSTRWSCEPCARRTRKMLQFESKSKGENKNSKSPSESSPIFTITHLCGAQPKCTNIHASICMSIDIREMVSLNIFQIYGFYLLFL